jgi:membrane protease YdiL (CAAX protease family)
MEKAGSLLYHKRKDKSKGGLIVEKPTPTVFAGNVLYLIATLSLVGLGYLSQFLFFQPPASKEGIFYLWVFVTEFVVILLPALLYLLVRRIPIKKAIRLKPLKLSQILVVAGLALSGYSVIAFLNYIWIWILTALGGQVVPPPIPAMETGRDLMLGIAMIAGMAALAEEFLFRGVMMRGYERYGPRTAILVSGILFGVLHMETQGVIAKVILGILIGYLVYRTDSILAGVVYHFVNNGIALVLAYFATWALEMNEKMGNNMAVSMDQLPQGAKILALSFLGIFALGALGVFIGLLLLLNHLSPKEPVEEKEEIQTFKKPVKAWHHLPLFVAWILIVGMYVLDIMRMF